MFSIIYLSILLAIPNHSACSYLEAEKNYLKPKLERNNVVNKGVWVRNKFKENLFEKTSLGDFIFRPNSLDADRLLQTNFDAFAENDMEESPIVSSYVERLRRSADQRHKRLSKKIRTKKLKHSTEDSVMDSKVAHTVKSSSVFNSYPYEVAIQLNNNKNEVLNIINDGEYNSTTTNDKSIEANETKIDVDDSKNFTEATTAEINKSTPKRSKKHSQGDNSKPQIDFNNTSVNEINKANRNIFDKDDKIWHQSVPIPNTNVYEIMPKDKIKPVTERGLIKVISMLTKTFKRITKQTGEVKQIYDKFNEMNNNFIKKVNDMNVKFQDFDSKYSDMIQFTERLKAIEDKLINEEEILKKKHKDMDINMIEFENQQMKFLAQQKQFYTIQKVMLAQNEKIHIKQSAIAKTQSDISHRQNNFARILKKTKQLFFDSRKPNYTNTIENNVNDTDTIRDSKTNVQNKTNQSDAESVKLNLFSIPTKNKLLNQDDDIIKEKDLKPIDDLVYKYYFKNTFIDSLMKSKILNNYATNTNSLELARNVKNKRDKLETTLLLPITTDSKDEKHRVRRWINHFNGKKQAVVANKKRNAKVLNTDPEFRKNDPNKSDPFSTMAKSFCNEIGQNTNEQSLNWCIEKALRRLRYMDKKLFAHPVTVMKQQNLPTMKKVVTLQHVTETPRVTLLPFVPSTVWLTTNVALDQVTTPLHAIPNQEVFFPDNEELESNLKQYDLTPDTEGTVYYDGSLHFSDIGQTAHDSDGMSDILPGFSNSNTHAEMNPIAFDLQSKRRAYVKKLNEDMIKKLKFRKL